jgi:cardiolipin synthase
VSWSGLPNLISVLRMLLVAPIIWALLHGQFQSALWLFVLAGLSDGLDGFLAKRFGWESRLGSLLDPLADKLLLVSCYVALAWLRLIPLWLAAAVLLRDVVIVSGAVAFQFRVGPVVASPSLISKLNTLAQLLLVIAVMFSEGVWALADTLILAMVCVVLITTVWSGVDYVRVWGGRWRLYEQHRSQ